MTHTTERAVKPRRLPLAFSLTIFNFVTLLFSAGASLFGTLRFFEKDILAFYFIVSAFIALFAIGVTATLQAAWALPRTEQSKYLSPILAIVAAAAYAYMFFCPDAFASGVAVFAAVACALSYVLQFQDWSHCFSALDAKKSLLGISLSAVIAGCAALLLFSFANSGAMVCAFSATLACGGITAARTRTSAEPIETSRESSGSNGALVSPQIGGLLICLFAMLIMWQGVDDSADKPNSLYITQGIFVGFIGCAAGISLIAALHPKPARFERSLAVLCPLFAAFPVFPCVIPAEPTPSVGMLFGVITGVGVGYFITVPAALLFKRDWMKSNSFKLGILALALSIDGLLAIVSSRVFEPGVSTALVCIVFIAFLVFCAIRRPSAPLRAAISDANSNGAEPTQSTDNAARSFVQEHKLTPRETEVFDALMQGYSQPAIAKMLFCSPETIKVHVRHIYEKAGVHSRDELTALVRNNPDHQK